MESSERMRDDLSKLGEMKIEIALNKKYFRLESFQYLLHSVTLIETWIDGVALKSE